MSTVETISETCNTICNTMLPSAFRGAILFARKKSSRPNECGVKLSANADGVEIIAGACDAGENTISSGFRARFPSNDFGAFADIVLPRGAAELWAKNIVETVNVYETTARAGGISVPVENGNEFPSFHSIAAPSAVYSLPFSVFRTIAEHIGSASDNESSRYALGGIFMESGADCMRFVGTDGRRLHVARIAGASDGAFSVVIPAELFALAVKAIDKSIDTSREKKKNALEKMRVVISFDDSNGRGAFSWIVGGVCQFEISWKKIDGRFPRYRDVFPDYLENSAAEIGSIETADIIAHAETCRKSVCSKNSKGIDISREFGENPTVSAKSAENGEYSRRLKAYLPFRFSTKLDPNFVIDAARAAAAFDPISDSVAVWANPDEIGTLAGKAGAVFLGKAGDIFTSRECRDAIFAAVIMPLAAD
jgi:DNA polymerase-3 subunit beta